MGRIGNVRIHDSTTGWAAYQAVTGEVATELPDGVDIPEDSVITACMSGYPMAALSAHTPRWILEDLRESRPEIYAHSRAQYYDDSGTKTADQMWDELLDWVDDLPDAKKVSVATFVYPHQRILAHLAGDRDVPASVHQAIVNNTGVGYVGTYHVLQILLQHTKDHYTRVTGESRLLRL